jgi:hypothetical protein
VVSGIKNVLAEAFGFEASDPLLQMDLSWLILHIRMTEPDFRPKAWENKNGDTLFKYRLLVWTRFIEKQFGSKPQLLLPDLKHFSPRDEKFMALEVELWVKVFLLLQELDRLGKLIPILPDRLRKLQGVSETPEARNLALMAHTDPKLMDLFIRHHPLPAVLFSLEAIINEFGLVMFVATSASPKGAGDFISEIQDINKYLKDPDSKKGFKPARYPVTSAVVGKAKKFDPSGEFAMNFYLPAYKARSMLTEKLRYSRPLLSGLDGKPVLARTGKKQKKPKPLTE